MDEKGKRKARAVIATAALFGLLALSGTVSAEQPDLNVTAIKVNSDYSTGHRELFANESNTIIATIRNLDLSNNSNASTVSFDIEGVATWKVPVSGLAAGASTDVSINWTPARGGTVLSPVYYNVTVTADCDGAVGETDETNNATFKKLTVYNNGYKGKRYTGGSDIETKQMQLINGNLIYSRGNSVYLGGGTWTSYTVNWTSGDLPVPGGATVKQAKLYVYYNWDPIGLTVNLTFNGQNYTMSDLDAHYKDASGYGSYPDNKYGAMVYNVKNNFNTGGNTATLTKVVTNNDVALWGMLLMVVYEHPSEAERLIWLNEESDILYAKSGYGTNETEATAYAIFTDTINISKVDAATLITVVPGGDSGAGNEDRLYFNDGAWDNVWEGAAGKTISINETDVKGNLLSENNLARLQSRGDQLLATNAFLVVEYKEEAQPRVVINEFEQNPPGTDSGNEWVELYNNGSEAVDISGWNLINSDGEVITIPPSTEIAAYGYWVTNWTTGSLVNDKENITLYNATGAEVDKTLTADDGSNNNRCWARVPNGYDSDRDSDWKFQACTRNTSNNLYNISITSVLIEQETAPDVNATYNLSITNLGNVADAIALNIMANEADLGALSADTFSLNAGGTATAYLNVSDSSAGIYNTTVRATSQGNTSVFAEVTIKTNVVTGSIAGTITYAWNGTEIVGAKVNLTKAGAVLNATVTNETGYYNFTGVIPARYVVKASKPRFWDNSTQVAVIADVTTTADMKLWLKGDLNNDGNVTNPDDIKSMLNASVGDISGDMHYDLNGNGGIGDAGDVVLMLRASVGNKELL